MSACTETERFAAFLRSLKNRSGLSYEALAGKSGIAGSTLHRYCRGTSVPQDYGSVHRLAKVCGAAPDELRNLHRLWALADASRTRETEERETGEREAGGQETGERETGERETAEGGVEAAADVVGGAEESASVPEPEPVSEPVAEPEPVRARDRFLRHRFRNAVVATAVLTIGISAWALSAEQPSSGNSNVNGSSGGPTDGRLLFSAACQSVVAMGQQDACVEEVQRLLHTKGADIGVDSSFGPQTLRRVTAFQVFAGLPPNGVVGDSTKKALYDSHVRMTVWSPAKVRQHIRAVFTEAPDEAVAIADCQSFLDPLHILPNTNGTRNWGLFQISDARLRELGGTPRQALDPEWNIKAAHRLWSSAHDFHDWPHCERAVKDSPTPR
ncbi:helix-turn-helix domain-containing protein [Streptomyces sp. NPDC050997]|uniref:helix-turn-helix domain-containing protein n=1 Tax=Streptomyces sp. NPDC050997 TaxID=3155519 RepID=UPI0034475274